MRSRTRWQGQRGRACLILTGETPAPRRLAGARSGCFYFRAGFRVQACSLASDISLGA